MKKKIKEQMRADLEIVEMQQDIKEKLRRKFSEKFQNKISPKKLLKVEDLEAEGGADEEE